MQCTNKTCERCKQLIYREADSITTGYGIKDDKLYCFPCCGLNDAEEMSSSDKHTLYFDHVKCSLTNWPGSFQINAQYKNSGNLHHVTCRFNGKDWYGKVGQHNQLITMRRKKST